MRIVCDRLSLLRYFVVFLNLSRHIPKQYFKLGHDHILFNLSFIYHPFVVGYIT
jgi:hypothetical protein